MTSPCLWGEPIHDILIPDKENDRVICGYCGKEWKYSEIVDEEKLWKKE